MFKINTTSTASRIRSAITYPIIALLDEIAVKKFEIESSGAELMPLKVLFVNCSKNINILRFAERTATSVSGALRRVFVVRILPYAQRRAAASGLGYEHIVRDRYIILSEYSFHFIEQALVTVNLSGKNRCKRG